MSLLECFRITGENVHYGTPTNPKLPSHIPGGSSSGSAVAVAAELVDFALGMVSQFKLQLLKISDSKFPLCLFHASVQFCYNGLKYYEDDEITVFTNMFELLKIFLCCSHQGCLREA